MPYDLAPLCLSAYPDDSERVYYPDRSRGIRGFSRVVVKWEPYQNMYRWKPHQEYEIKYPGRYQLETPQGYCLLYQPIVHVNMDDFMTYIKQTIYKRVIEYPQKVEDPETGAVTWNYSFHIRDVPANDDYTRFPDPPTDVPDPKAGEDVTTLMPAVVELPQCWSRSELLIQIADDAPFHDMDQYEGHLRYVGIDLFNHFSAESVDVIFDGQGYHRYTGLGEEFWTPQTGSTEGLWHGFKCTITSATMMPRDPRFSFTVDQDVVVAPGTGLVCVYADNGDVVCDMHWNPATSPAWTVHVDRAFVHNGYVNTVGSRAELRIGSRTDRNTVATFVPIGERGVCTLLFNPDKILLGDPND